jgi:hypothetical protein
MGRNMHEVIKPLFWPLAQYIVNLFYNFHKILGLKKNNANMGEGGC